MIREILDPNEKSVVCDRILRALPDWFGIEEGVADYVQSVRTMLFFTAYIDDAPAGFIALKKHNPYTSEVYVMGILPQYHRQGIGRKLIAHCEAVCREEQQSFLTVKTLDSSREDVSYAKTRAFYEAIGFVPLEVFPTLWDESNPCLFLAKYLG